jgi:hypothetical protein
MARGFGGQIFVETLDSTVEREVRVPEGFAKTKCTSPRVLVTGAGALNNEQQLCFSPLEGLDGESRKMLTKSYLAFLESRLNG